MKRLILAAVIGLAVQGAAWAAGLPATLRQTALVEGEVILLGDIWDNLGDKASVPLVNAPQPGKRATLDARWLSAAAAAHGIDWRPATVFEKIVVERAGQKVDPALIETEVREALALEGVPANAAIDIANRAALAVVVPAGTPNTVAVRDLIWDARHNRFTATVELPAAQPAVARLKVSGRIATTTRVPVLTRLINRGDVITERDVEMVDLRDEQVRADVVTDVADLIGREPRLQLRPGVAVRRAEIQRPVVVQKNSMVTMVLQTPFMKLTTQGKAVEDGGQGDVIRITNLQSKKTVEARVQGPGLVVVAAGPRVLAN